MRPGLILTAALILAGPVAAQGLSDMRDLRLRFGQAVTRAVADFHSADSVERNLRRQGNTLHPSLMALRLHIEAALDESEAALNKGEIEAAQESIGRAEELIGRFGRKLGGD